MELVSTTCVIAGGGPAGMICGYLLARAGIDVTVLEKHADFLRDFRGDTVHPSTLQILHELGLLPAFLQLAHTRILTATIEFGDAHFVVGDFTRLPTLCKFVALMPQWDFLDFLAREAKKFPNFHLLMQTQVHDVTVQGARDGSPRICGLLATTTRGQEKTSLQIEAALSIAADGRHSSLREKSGLRVQNLGAPFDVLWLRLPVRGGDPVDLIGKARAGQFFVMIYRGQYWQCAYIIAKGSFDAIKREGLAKFRLRLKDIAGFAADRVDETIRDFDQIKLLTVAVDRLARWARPGLLCIGDAAHAMSPIGGVGINLAIQDGVAAANILAPILKKRAPNLRDLDKVQRRRGLATRAVQAFQVAMQNHLLAPTLAAAKAPKVPLLVRLLNQWPWLRQFPARFIGIGLRPEHVRLAAQSAPIAAAQNRITVPVARKKN